MSAIGVTTGAWLTINTVIGTSTLVESGPPLPSLVAVKTTLYVPFWCSPGVQLKRAVSGSNVAPGGRPADGVGDGRLRGRVGRERAVRQPRRQHERRVVRVDGECRERDRLAFAHLPALQRAEDRRGRRGQNRVRGDLRCRDAMSLVTVNGTSACPPGHNRSASRRRRYWDRASHSPAGRARVCDRCAVRVTPLQREPQMVAFAHGLIWHRGKLRRGRARARSRARCSR